MIIEILKFLGLTIIFLLICSDLSTRFFDKKFKKIKLRGLTITNYLGIAILILLLTWNNFSEIAVGNVSFKRIENKLTTLESSIEYLFNRRKIEYIKYDDFVNIKVDKPDGEKYYHYEILLKEKPVENSVELWLGNNPQNPKYFSVFSDEKRVVYRHESNIKWLKDYLQGVEPAITISYIPLSR